MTKYNYYIKYNQTKVSFYFLENCNSLQKIELDDPKVFFGQKLSEFLFISNEKKFGVPLNQSTINHLTSLILEKTLAENNKTNCFEIKNNNFTAYFYTLTEFHETEKLQVVRLWKFQCSNSIMSREFWVKKNELVLKNCCLRNFLISEMETKELNLEKTATYAENYCIFPSSFVDIEVLVTNYLVKSNQKNTTSTLNNEQKEYSCFINPEFTVKYIYSPLNKGQTIENNLVVNYLLSNLGNNSQFNLNCRDLFSHISVKDDTFLNFIKNCLLTIFLNEFFIIDKNQQESITGFNLLCCSLVFNKN